MKTILKKITAIAMVFTILGTGTVLTNAFVPKFDSPLIANAACMHSEIDCIHSEWITYYYKMAEPVKILWMTVPSPIILGEYQYRVNRYYCTSCGVTFYEKTEYRYLDGSIPSKSY